MPIERLFREGSHASREYELTDAVALAIASTASSEHSRNDVRELCRRLESAVLASDAGPLGWELLEKVDARLREAVGEHDFLDGRYA